MVNLNIITFRWPLYDSILSLCQYSVEYVGFKERSVLGRCHIDIDPLYSNILRTLTKDLLNVYLNCLFKLLKKFPFV